MIDNPQTDRTVEERVAHYLAARDWLTTEDRWDSATASFRAEYLAAAREVIAPVQPAVPVPPATHATDEERRNRYADAVRTAGDTAYGNRPFYEAITDAVIAIADTELAARRAADLRDAEEICDEAGASYTDRALNEHADAAYTLMERFRRKAEEAEQTADEARHDRAQTPCTPA